MVVLGCRRSVLEPGRVDVVLWIEEVAASRGFNPPSIYAHSAKLPARENAGWCEIYPIGVNGGKR